MDVVTESVVEVFEQRDQVQGLRFTYEPEVLRFFQARFELVPAPHKTDGLHSGKPGLALDHHALALETANR